MKGKVFIMGFWIYFIFPLLLSLIMLSLTKWEKVIKIKQLLKVFAVVLVVVALAFAAFVVFYGVRNQVVGSDQLYLAMLVASIGYTGLSMLIKTR